MRLSKANLVIAQLSGSQAGGRELAQMIYNFRSGIAFTKSTTGIIGKTVGRVVGGSDYLKNRKQGHGKMESLNMSVHSTRNQKVVQEGEKKGKQKAKQYAGAVTRMATMPVGVLKDLMQGGAIQAGKTLYRVCVTWRPGTTLTSRAEVKPKKNKIKEEAVAVATTEAKKTEEKATSDTSSNRGSETAEQQH